MHSAARDGRFRTLRFRLTFWNTAGILVLVLTVLTCMREGLRWSLQRELDALLVEDFDEVRRLLEHYHPDRARIREELDRKAVSHKARAWFARVSVGGREDLATTGAPDPELDLPDDPPLRPFNVAGYRVVQRPLRKPAGLVLRVGCSQEFVTDDVDNLTRIAAFAALGVVVLAPLSGYWLAGRATRP